MRAGMMNAGGDKVEATLGAIIANTRRLKSLSHRAVMFALLDAADEAGDDAAMTAFGEALAAFGEIVGSLRGAGEAADAEAQAAIRKANALDGEADRQLTRFMTDAQRLRELSDVAARRAMLKELAEFVAGPLYEAIEEIDGGLQRALAHATAARTERDAAARQLIGESIDKIEKVSFAVRLIALNASVEAARAGAFGKGFSVIASEIKSLSESTSTTVQDLQRQLATMR